MFEYMKHIDTSLFLMLNSMHNEFFDTAMWQISKTITWIPLYATLVYFLFKQHGWKKASFMVLTTLAAVGLSDFVASGIIKNTVCRLRPSQDPSIQGLVHIVRDYKGGMYGFVSSHAANTFAIAVCMGYFFNRKWLWYSLLVWCSTVSYSRIYLGVHYPGDIIGGAIVGITISLICTYTYHKISIKSCKTI